MSHCGCFITGRINGNKKRDAAAVQREPWFIGNVGVKPAEEELILFTLLERLVGHAPPPCEWSRVEQNRRCLYCVCRTCWMSERCFQPPADVLLLWSLTVRRRRSCIRRRTLSLSNIGNKNIHMKFFSFFKSNVAFPKPSPEMNPVFLWFLLLSLPAWSCCDACVSPPGLKPSSMVAASLCVEVCGEKKFLFFS